MNKAKENWIQKVASDAEAAVKDGEVRWNNIYKLQQVYRGHRPWLDTTYQPLCLEEAGMWCLTGLENGKYVVKRAGMVGHKETCGGVS